MQLTLMIAHLGTNCETIQVNIQVHQSTGFSKVHNSVKLDVCSCDIRMRYSWPWQKVFWN